MPEKKSRRTKKKVFAKILEGDNFLIYSTNITKRQPTEKQRPTKTPKQPTRKEALTVRKYWVFSLIRGQTFNFHYF